MTPAHWQPVLQRAGGIVAAAQALGIDRDTVSAYAAGTRPTPRKVALAVAAWMAGLRPYGDA